MRRVVAAAVVALALAVALIPVSRPWVDAVYWPSMFLVWQPWITGASNTLPFALLDVVLVAVPAVWLWRAATCCRHEPWRLAAWRVVSSAAVLAALVYLCFAATWGLNYRRSPIETRVAYSSSRITPQAAMALARVAVTRLNALHEPAHRALETAAVPDEALEARFARVQRALGAPRLARPAPPKRSLLDWYFRRAGVDGMTDPFFLETLLVSSLLPVERPFVIAHEWSHLAGYAHEGEANLVGFLVAVGGSAADEYSAWLFLYSEIVGSLPSDARAALRLQLADGPRADLLAIRARVTREVSRGVSVAGWAVYDQYLKANRVPSGAASYREVVRLLLGTEVGADWVPVRR